MKTMSLFFLFMLLLYLPAESQDIPVTQNIPVTFAQEGANIVIYYELNQKSGFTYSVRVFCSQDGGRTFGPALKSVAGDVGAGITAGRDKKIVWDVLSDQDGLEGNPMFRVEAVEEGQQKAKEAKTPSAEQAVDQMPTVTGATGGNAEFMTDPRDGKRYLVVTIGSQTWMAENLDFHGRGMNATCYNEKEANCEQFGALYGWEVAKTACPTGWHLPTDKEWDMLFDAVGGKKKAAAALKSAASDTWELSSSRGTDTYGFTALPGGLKGVTGSYARRGTLGGFWTASKHGPGSWFVELRYDDEKVYFTSSHPLIGRSVRCLKDRP